MKHDDIKLTLIEWKLLQWLAAKVKDCDYYPSFTAGQLYVFFHPNEDFNTQAEKAALKFKALDLFDIDEFGNHRLNRTGFKLAKEIERPEWIRPKVPKLSDRDIGVLEELNATGYPWNTPLDIGAWDSSYHGASLIKLVKNGYAVCRYNYVIKTYDSESIVTEPILGHRRRGSRKFKITPKGVKFLKTHDS